MTPHERKVMQEALDACRKDYLHAIESINLEIRLGACRVRASELTVKHDEIVQRIKQIDRACLAQPEYAESTKEKHDEFVAMRNKSF